MIEIRRILAKNGVFASDDQLSLLGQFVGLLREWNKRVNLVSRRDVDNVWEAHILHSLGLLLEVSIPKSARVLDLGSGGGLPGIPISIIRPDLKVTMIDATRKKIGAVEAMVAQLGIKDAATVWGRVEEKKTIQQLAGRFDMIVARAVAALPDLVAWSYPLISATSLDQVTSPHLVTLKGGDLNDEIGKVGSSALVRDVRAKDLTFHGAEAIPGVRKQIVTVHFSTQGERTL